VSGAKAERKFVSKKLKQTGKRGGEVNYFNPQMGRGARSNGLITRRSECGGKKKGNTDQLLSMATRTQLKSHDSETKRSFCINQRGSGQGVGG